MNFILKLKKEGQLKNNSYELIIIKKKTSIYGKYIDKIGNYIYLDKNNSYLYINKKKLLFWIKFGIQINKKLNKIIKIC